MQIRDVDHQARPTILVVDDTPTNIDILRELLQPHFRVKASKDGQLALEIARTMPQPDMILLDIMMPGLDGLETLRRLKNDPLTSMIPVIFITAMTEEEDEERGLALGAVDYITKPFSPPVVLARVRTQLALRHQNIELERLVQDRTQELASTRMEIIRRLGRAAEFRDNETGLHVIRMSNYAHRIALALGGNEAWAALILNAAPMHDVGKIGIPDNILLKPGRLDPGEWETMRRHPEIGAEIIGDGGFDLMRMSHEIALSHHEKYDGSGYPRSLKGGDIPLSARIVAVADVFDALTTERPYKKAWPVSEALRYIDENVGRHFDPELVRLFHRVMPEILKIRETYAERPMIFASPGGGTDQVSSSP